MLLLDLAQFVFLQRARILNREMCMCDDSVGSAESKQLLEAVNAALICFGEVF